MDDQLSDADLMELNRLVTELAWRVDHRRADAVADLFVDDGEMALGSAAMRDREEIGAWGTQRASAGYATRHVCTNMRFEASGDGAATGTTVVTLYLHNGDGPGDTTAHAVGSTRTSSCALRPVGASGHAGWSSCSPRRRHERPGRW
jgi:hypothetical protein